MAAQLKAQFGGNVVTKIGVMVAAAYPPFDLPRFQRQARAKLETFELMDRGRHIAEALRQTLPEDIRRALRILTDSFGPTLDEEPNPGMGAFLYLPHSFFIGSYCLNVFDDALRAQYELTKRFTAEFSIRPFLQSDPDRVLRFLRQHLSDPSRHVRRWISEGTRPRLPWAPQIAQFRKDPRPVLELLEQLRDDPAEYVRRSVANNLNDIWKDNPATVYATLRRWKPQSSPTRRWIADRALRNAIKERNIEALSLLGIRAARTLKVSDRSVVITSSGGDRSVVVTFSVTNTALKSSGEVIVDFQIHYVKQSGGVRAKVFKLSTMTLAPGEKRMLTKRISLNDMTTRRHYPGCHLVEGIVNGVVAKVGSFTLSRSMLRR